MQTSRYIKTYPAGNSRKIILYSTKNAAIAEIPVKMAERLAAAGFSKENRKTLKKMGFFVNDALKERHDILNFIRNLNHINGSLSIKAVMNLDCNLACRYCFEGSRKGRFYMTRQTADDFVRFVKEKTLSKGNFKDILITFYGGEPLLSKELIIYLSRELKSFADKMKIGFKTYFITNGTLLTSQTVKLLKPLGLKEAQITIDGPRDVHNGFRPYRSGLGSFDMIVKNVKDISRLIDVCISGNYSRDSFREFPRLLTYLLRNGLGPGSIKSVQFTPIMTERADIGPDFHDGCSSVTEPWVMNAFLYLREEILKRGFRFAQTSPGLCMTEYEDNLLVNYDGSIYKCPGMIGRKEFCVGDIRTGIKDYRKSHNLDNWKNEECLDCSYLPLCFGGCRYMKYIRDGNMNGIDCRKPYFDACLETLVKQDIKYGLTV